MHLVLGIISEGSGRCELYDEWNGKENYILVSVSPIESSPL